MVDKNTIFQVLCSLMNRPYLLDEVEKYQLTPQDFSSLFEKYIFSAVYNLHKDGAEKVSVIDIENYLSAHQTAQTVFTQYNGAEVLTDALDVVQEDNFPFYYKRLKKFNCIRDLKKMGMDTSKLYCDDLTKPEAKEINDKFEVMSVNDIFQVVKGNIVKVEAQYSSASDSEAVSASKGLRTLYQTLQRQPEIGASLQGEIFNTVCRGARKGKFYIRTASSGTGKTRSAIGDACFLSYPVRFNQTTWKWEAKGSCEKTLFICTEQEVDEIQTLVLAYLTGINEEKILYGTYTEEEREIIEQAIMITEEYDNLYIARIPDPSIQGIKAVVRSNWIKYNVSNVFYDYIFSSPNLLSEFRDLGVREDVALGMMSTALKDLAVELDVFMMSSTQTNAKADEHKNELSIRGARSIIDKCDLACILSLVTDDELELLKETTSCLGMIPNQVIDVYKNRRGKYSKVRIWCDNDLGNCRRRDFFMTTTSFKPFDDFQPLIVNFDDENNIKTIEKTVTALNNREVFLDTNNSVEKKDFIEVSFEEGDNPIQNNVESSTKTNVSTSGGGLFEGLL